MQRLVRGLWSGLLGVTVATAAARAETKHYGGGIAVVDTIAVGSFVGGVACLSAAETDVVDALCGLAALGGAIAYMVSGPVAHSKHGKSTTASVALAMRLVLPFGGSVAGAALADCSDDDTCIAGFVAAGIGIVAASSIDALLFARAEVATPYVAPASGGATVGVAGRF